MFNFVLLFYYYFYYLVASGVLALNTCSYPRIIFKTQLRDPKLSLIIENNFGIIFGQKWVAFFGTFFKKCPQRDIFRGRFSKNALLDLEAFLGGVFCGRF